MSKPQPEPRSPEEITWIEYTPRSLLFTRKTAPPFDEWERVVLGMDVQIDSDAFWRADVMIIGAIWYGEDRATAVIDDEHGTAKTWQNNYSVGRRIPPDGINDDLEIDPDYESRRRDDLTYSHHAEVAYMRSYLETYFERKEISRDPTQEDVNKYQAKYLKMAADQGLSVTKLRAKIRYDLLGEGEDPTGDEVSFKMGTWIQRVEKVDTKLRDLVDEAPEDWDEEARLLANARRSVTDALHSARNRDIGGDPQATPEAEAEPDKAPAHA